MSHLKTGFSRRCHINEYRCCTYCEKYNKIKDKRSEISPILFQNKAFKLLLLASILVSQ